MGTPKRIKWRSGLEKSFGELLKRNSIPFKFEVERVKYIQPQAERSYTIDFSIDGLHIETKGRFTSEDRKKMLLVRQQHPDFNFIMVFNNARTKKLYKGSPTTYADWCDKNGIKWLELKDIERDINCLLSMTNTEMPSCLKTPQKRSKKQSSK